MGQRIEGAMTFAGRITLLSVDLPTGAVTNDSVVGGTGINASKLEHQHQPNYSQESGTTAAAADRVIHTVHGAVGIVTAFTAGCVVANIGAAVVTVDLHKNGSTMLTAAITVDSGDAAYDVVAATVDPAEEAVAVDDVLEVVVTVAAGGGTLGKGVFAQAVIEEDAA